MVDLVKYTKQLSKLFVESNNILLISHINPDGDAIGAQIALCQYLKYTGKTVSMMAPNYIQEFLKWMEGSEQIRIFIKEKRKCIGLVKNADLIVMLDFNQANRMGEAEELVMGSKATKILIDHHLDPSEIADLIISEPSFCSTSELIHRLICNLYGKPFINKVYAEALYTGIITDTGNFEHGSYTPDTMRIVADLLETGLDKARILDLIYNNFSADRMRLMGFALNEKMVVIPELNSAYISLSKEDLKKYHHLKGDTEGFVNMPLSIKGVLFSTLFIEKDGFIKLSFRSKGKFPSNEIASQYFSGGGHMNASGGEYYDTLDNTIKYFLEILNENSWRFKNI